jgi:hypothetical protein
MDATQAAEAMAEQAGEEVATEVVENEATGDQEVVPTDESVLPSDETEATELSEMDQLREQIAGLEAKVKKGKDASSQRGQADKDASDAAEVDNNRNDFYEESLSDMIDNGITAEHIERAEELGLSPEQLELSVLKTEKIQSAVYNEAGGKESYDNAIEGLTDIYTEAQKQAFSEGIQNPALAPMLVRSLMADYAKLDGNQKVTNLSNNAVVSNNTNNSYTDRGQYNKDMAAMRRAPSSQQQGMQRAIDAKLGRSDGSVLRG